MNSILNEKAIQERLRTLPEWRYEAGAITKTFITKNFQRAIAFVTTIGMLAELADHHPDISIRYNKIRIDLSTHSAGGVTEKDFQLAEKITEAFFG